MHALQREDTGVAKVGLVPIAVGGFVAKLAGRRKSGGRMVRVSGLFVIGAMTTVAISRRSGINPVPMAGGAVECGMDALAGKDAVMVEGRLIPAGMGRQMTELARCRESRLNVVRFGGFLIVFAMAGIAVESGQLEVPVFMAAVTA